VGGANGKRSKISKKHQTPKIAHLLFQGGGGGHGKKKPKKNKKGPKKGPKNSTF